MLLQDSVTKLASECARSNASGRFFSFLYTRSQSTRCGMKIRDTRRLCTIRSYHRPILTAVRSNRAQIELQHRHDSTSSASINQVAPTPSSIEDEDSLSQDPKDDPLSEQTDSTPVKEIVATPEHQMKSKSSATEPPLSSQLRHLMRAVPHSVVVITTATTPHKQQEFSTDPSHYRGMTLSTFTSLSLSPTPRITFNIKRPSMTLGQLRRTKHFLVHILEASEAGAKIADLFTRGSGGRQAFKLLATTPYQLPSSSKISSTRKKDTRGALSLPRITGPGVKRVLLCRLNRTVLLEARHLLAQSGSDHELLIAEVHDIIKSADTDADGTGWKGLCYVDGHYCGVEKPIEFSPVRTPLIVKRLKQNGKKQAHEQKDNTDYTPVS
ncbi:flavin reductase like domain-containing protein [Amylocarpus encephaloides]|uniref:Flavin reductase like domain-containing protein n=1 Tax=Amylocarpus encephaloides TaxID=45428 RepID=A0A9P7YC99_9HELO|nr:flavin reductase like domain-containing protein [Amylocarpus encephaloides]